MVCSSRPTVADGMREVRSSGCRSCRAPPHVSTHWARTADAFRRPLSEMVGSRRLMLVANLKPRLGAGRRPHRHASRSSSMQPSQLCSTFHGAVRKGCNSCGSQKIHLRAWS